MQDDCHIFGNGKSSKTTKSTSQIPLRLGVPQAGGEDEGESYTLFRTLPKGRKSSPYSKENAQEKRLHVSWESANPRFLVN